MLGGLPFTDGGTYQYNAWLAANVDGSLPTAPLNVYSWFASLFAKPADAPFVPARVVDAIALAGAAAALTWLLRRCRAGWPIAAVLAFVWTALWSTPVFCDAGFKNPIVAASGPAFVALGLLLSPTPRPFMAGLLVAAAIALREAFAPLALLVPLLALLRSGGRAGVRAAIGGALGAAALLLWMTCNGMSPADVLENFRAMSRNANGLLAMTGEDPAAVRLANLERTLHFAWGTLCLPLLALLVTTLCALGRSRPAPLRRLRRSGPAMACVVLLLMPLPEIFGKFCLPYHWLQLVPATLLAAAIADRHLRALQRIGRAGGLLRGAVWLGSGVLLWSSSGPVRAEIATGMGWHQTFSPVMCDGDWQHDATRYSRYLQVARWLRENSPPDATLIVSGYAYTLYPLSARRPASAHVSDLTFSRLTGQPERHPDWLDQLREAQPDLVLETLRWPEPLTDVWPDFSERYELAHEWPRDPGVHYGNFGMRLWRRR